MTHMLGRLIAVDEDVLKELKLDAARYRWLRSVGGRSWTHLEKQERSKYYAYDLAVDAAMKVTK